MLQAPSRQSALRLIFRTGKRLDSIGASMFQNLGEGGPSCAAESHSGVESGEGLSPFFCDFTVEVMHLGAL